MKRKVMRLLILGDESVGKTSLISAMMFDNDGQLAKKLNKVSLSPQRCIYSKDIFTELIDTDAQSDIKTQIQNADIILLVYDISEQSTIQRIETHWLPIISSIRNTVPVILVGNKLDKKQLEICKQLEYTNVRAIIKGLSKKHRQVQMGFQCSAYYDRNVKKVLNCAQRAVLYPLAPLYDLNNKQLTFKFKKAIQRIFRILDTDLDGKITDAQLRSLQQRVFQTDLNGQDIKAIKQIILKQLEQFHQDHIKLNGFFALQKKCIQMLKIQVCWSILRYFNYNDDLQINYTHQEFILDESKGQALELSPNVLTFLQKIYSFSLSQKSQNQSAMQYLFSCSPSIPLQEFKEQNITLQKFLLSWMMFAFIDYKQCYRNLLYIGYEDGLEGTFKKVRSKKSYTDLLKLRERKLFTVLIVEKNNDKFSNYFNLLFKKSVSFSLDNYLVRDSFLFNEQNKQSKVLLLLKIKQKYLEQFLQKNQLKNRIDLMLTFQNGDEDEQYRNFKGKTDDEIINVAKLRLSSHTMIRKFSKKQCDQLFKVKNGPSLNLQSFPVEFKDQNWSTLFGQIIKSFEKLQLGYSVQKLQKLKKQSQNKNKLWTGLGIVGVTVLGCLAFKKNPFNLIKELK